METTYWSETARLIAKAIPEADPARGVDQRMRYLCDVPQRELDHITGSVPSEISSLCDGLSLTGKMIHDQGLDPIDAKRFGAFVALVAELIGELSRLEERADMMTEDRHG